MEALHLSKMVCPSASFSSFSSFFSTLEFSVGALAEPLSTERATNVRAVAGTSSSSSPSSASSTSSSSSSLLLLLPLPLLLLLLHFSPA